MPLTNKHDWKICSLISKAHDWPVISEELLCEAKRPPKYPHGLTSIECEYDLLHGKMGFGDVLNVINFKKGDYSKFSGSPNIIL
jgi:hypothetical protein